MCVSSEFIGFHVHSTPWLVIHGRDTILREPGWLPVVLRLQRNKQCDGVASLPAVVVQTNISFLKLLRKCSYNFRIFYLFQEILVKLDDFLKFKDFFKII